MSEQNVNRCGQCIGNNPGILNDHAQTRFRVVCQCGNGVDSTWWPNRELALKAWNAANPTTTPPAPDEVCPDCFKGIIVVHGFHCPKCKGTGKKGGDEKCPSLAATCNAPKATEQVGVEEIMGRSWVGVDDEQRLRLAKAWVEMKQAIKMKDETLGAVVACQFRHDDLQMIIHELKKQCRKALAIKI